MPSSPEVVPVPVPGATTGTTARAVLPFVPLAIALLASRALIPSTGPAPANPTFASTVSTTDPSAPAKCGEVGDFRQCHSDYPSGCSLSAAYDGYLNLLKNQDVPPPPPSRAERYLTSLQDYRALEAGTPTELSKRNHSQFKDQLAKLGEGQIYGIVGYLYYAKESGKESSNCELGDHDAVDYHIGIGFDPQLAPTGKAKGQELKNLEQNSVIVEMTPHYRFNYHPDWDIDAVLSAVGKQVRVVGQLIIDSEHNNAAQNCGFSNPDMAKCWRASSWELHPVMQFQVCASGTCTATLGDWVELTGKALDAQAPFPETAKPKRVAAPAPAL